MVKKGLPTNALGKKIVDKMTIKEFHDVVGHWKKDILEGMAAEMGLELIGELPPCEGCIQAESKRQKFRKIVKDPAKEPLDIIHVDTSGPFPYSTLEGNRYLYLFVDGYKGDSGKRRQWVYFTKSKDESHSYYVIREFVLDLKRDYNRVMNRIRSDNGTEYDNPMINDFLLEERVKQEFTAAHSPQENGVAERNISFN
jgi:hypothetical protein